MFREPSTPVFILLLATNVPILISSEARATNRQMKAQVPYPVQLWEIYQVLIF